MKNICLFGCVSFYCSLIHIQSFESLAIGNPLFVLFLIHRYFLAIHSIKCEIVFAFDGKQTKYTNGWCVKRWTVKWTMAWNRINAYPNRMNLINVIKLAVFIIIWSREKILCTMHASMNDKKKKWQCYQWQPIKNAIQFHINVTQSLVCYIREKKNIANHWFENSNLLHDMLCQSWHDHVYRAGSMGQTQILLSIWIDKSIGQWHHLIICAI